MISGAAQLSPDLPVEPTALLRLLKTPASLAATRNNSPAANRQPKPVVARGAGDNDGLLKQAGSVR